MQVTYAGTDPAGTTVMVGALVTGVSESGGVCTATVSDGTSTWQGESDGVADASSTSCGEIDVAVEGDGPWQVSVSYASSTARGTSATTTASAATP